MRQRFDELFRSTINLSFKSYTNGRRARARRNRRFERINGAMREIRLRGFVRACASDVYRRFIISHLSHVYLNVGPLDRRSCCKLSFALSLMLADRGEETLDAEDIFAPS